MKYKLETWKDNGENKAKIRMYDDTGNHLMSIGIDYDKKDDIVYLQEIKKQLENNKFLQNQQIIIKDI